MEKYYTIKFLTQKFKRHKLINEIVVASITLKADTDSNAFNEAEFLLSVNNPEIDYNCMALKIDYTATQFKYDLFK